MAALWQCRDQWGRTVVLTDGAWFGHILVEHAVMRPHRHRVRQTVESPEKVRRDQTKHRNEVYYRRWPLRRRGRVSWLKVVVQFTVDPATNTESGTVLTAYPMRRPKPGETRKWP